MVELSKELMYKQREINKAPAWRLTELAIAKGKELARKYNEDERLILTSLYLAHTVFSPIWQGEIQKNHPLSETLKKQLESLEGVTRIDVFSNVRVSGGPFEEDDRNDINGVPQEYASILEKESNKAASPMRI